MARIMMVAYTNYRRDPRVKREAEALVEVGHEVVVFARRQPGEPNRELVSNVEVIKVLGFNRKCVSFAEYMFDYCCFFLLIFLHLLIHPLRYACIHINNMPDFLVFATLIPRLLGVPVIHDIHDLMPELFLEKFSSGENHLVVRLLKFQEKWAGRFASKVITVEARLKDILSGRGIPHHKIVVLMNLPDDRIFSLRESILSESMTGTFVLAYHGTLAKRLGLDIAIEAIAKARESIPMIEFWIIGAGEERENLLRLRTQLNLVDCVKFSDGFVPVEQIPAMLKTVDVGVLPLRACSGTDIMLPTKLLEYVSMGIPCIVPRTGTIARYFDDDMVRFFEAENVNALAEAIIELYHNPSKRMELSANSSTRFASIYRWCTHKKTYTDLVGHLLDKSSH